MKPEEPLNLLCRSRRLFIATVMATAGVLAGCNGESASLHSPPPPPVPAGIINHLPVASIDAPASVRVGEEITLDASASTDADGDALAFAWRQAPSVIDVALVDAGTATVRFVVPDSAAGRTLAFHVDVSDGKAISRASIMVPVKAASSQEAPELALVFPPTAALWPVTLPRELTFIVEATDNGSIETVTIGNSPATPISGNRWSARMELAAGLNPIAVTARDNAGNETNAEFSVDTTAAAIGSGPLEITRQMIHDPETDLVYMANPSGSVIALDLSTGIRTEISGDSVGDGPQITPGALALDAAAQVIYVVDLGSVPSVHAVDIASGDRTVISDAGTGSGPAFESLVGAAYDPGNERLFALDFSRATVFEVDVETGARTVVSDASVGSGPLLSNPRSLLFDPASGMLLVANANSDSVLTVDPDNGNRVELTGRSVGTGPDFERTDMSALDAANRVLYVVEATVANNRVFRVDMNNGNRTLVDMSDEPGVAEPEGIAWDSRRQLLHIYDDNSDAIFTVEPVSGERVIIGKL